MIACTLLSGALAAARLVPTQHISSARQFGKVTVLALIFCLTVVLGNISLKYIPVSFNQVWSSQCRLAFTVSPCLYSVALPSQWHLACWC